jgi:NAD(P)-dependent dehydrogenase (short-subunit alcohol dehydrogenase family)
MSFKTGSQAARVVLITGAASGMGKECAERLAASGWRVFGGARQALELDGGVEGLIMDVDDEISVRRAIDAVLAKAGRLNAVINCAGFLLCGAVEDVTIEEAKALFETNFFGVLRVCRAALPTLRASGGHMVNISGLAGVVALPFTAHYSASKFAVEGLSEGLRLEARPFGVKVVLVEPSYIRTKLMAKRRNAVAARIGVYSSAFDRLMSKGEETTAAAPPPDCVALLIERVLNNPDPKLRYTVGSFERRHIPLLKRILPQRTFEWVLRRVIGV